MYYIDRDNAHQCLERLKIDSERKNSLARLVNVYWDLAEGRSVRPEDLLVFREIMFDSRNVADCEEAFTALRLLGHRHPELLVLWVEAAASSNWKTRRLTAAFLHWAPLNVMSDLLPRLLEDRSKAVREFALASCMQWDRSEWLSHLVARRPIEAEEKLRKIIDQIVELISTKPIIKGDVRHKHIESTGTTFEQTLDGRFRRSSRMWQKGSGLPRRYADGSTD